MKRGLGLILSIAAGLLVAAPPARAEDGYRLWLRYPEAAAATSSIEIERHSPMIDAAAAELRRGLAGRIARVLLVTTADPRVAVLRLSHPLGEEGYTVRSAQIGGEQAAIIAADDERGLLYGAFALLRHLDTGGSPSAINLRSAPRIRLRVVDHWDNLDGFVERGYAGN